MQPLCDSLRTNGAQVTESINTFSKRISAWKDWLHSLLPAQYAGGKAQIETLFFYLMGEVVFQDS